MTTLSTPDPVNFAATESLCLNPNPYDAYNDSIFADAMYENISWHSTHCDFYNKFLQKKNFQLETYKKTKDLNSIPFILADFFKTQELLSIPKDQTYLHLTSSGTRGQKSQIYFDEWSIKSAQRMVDMIFNYYKWVSPEKTHYLLFSYEPKQDFKSGTSFTDHFLCKYAPIESSFCALKNSPNGSHEFDFYGTIEYLKSCEKSKLPVRIFGFPAFLHFTLKGMRDLGLPPLVLNPNSLIFLGGGWKNHQGQAITKKSLYNACTQQLGIPDNRLRDGFGSVEHCVPYIECKEHNFHIPQWSRVVIRDFKTLEPLEDGKVGFLQFISPYITSVPAQSVLMSDAAVKHPSSACRCGLPVPFFEIVGRAGNSKNKSCALAASELLKDMRL